MYGTVPWRQGRSVRGGGGGEGMQYPNSLALLREGHTGGSCFMSRGCTHLRRRAHEVRQAAGPTALASARLKRNEDSEGTQQE